MKLVAAGMVFVSGVAAALEGPTIMEMKEMVAAAGASARPEKRGKISDPKAVKALLFELKVEATKIWASLTKENKLWEQAHLHAKLGDYDRAYNIAQKIVRTQHAGGRGGRSYIINRGDVHAFLAEILAAVGRQEAAMQAVEEAWSRAQEPGVPIYVQNRIRRSKKYIEEYPEKGKAYEEAKERYEASPEDGDALFRLIEALKQLRWREKERFVALARLRETFPEHPHVRDGRAYWDFGHASNKLGMYRRAAETFEYLVKNRPNHSLVKGGEANWQAGRSHQMARQYAKALEHYRTVQEKYPKHRVNKPRRRRSRVPLPPELPQRVIECERKLGP